MAIQKHNYELSIWNEKLTNNGKEEYKQQIIGANDMSHLGRATNIHFKKLLNGTHVLTFQMPTKFFNSEIGDYVQNELIENLLNEQKIKLFFKNKWYELIVKEINESKSFKSIMKNFTCSDGFIDELSRTGYDIQLDPELNNSVNEINVFMDTILEDSVWGYKPEWNWGDFTEFREERFFKVPLSCFGGSIQAYKLDLKIPCAATTKPIEIENAETGAKRPLEYGDDLAGQKKIFWNSKDNQNTPLFVNKTTITGDYIYVPMSDLKYISTYLYKNLSAAAQSTETFYSDSLDKYALQPYSNNPKDIIQFIYFNDNDEVAIDEAGVMTDYNYTYILTIEDWEKQNISNPIVYYKDAENQVQSLERNIKSLNSMTWKPVYYDGFLEKIGDYIVTKARRINITNRTELNVYDNIFVDVYNNTYDSYKDMLTEVPSEGEYRLLSKIDTRTILPTLARNIISNGQNITDTNGWDKLIQVSEDNQVTSIEVKTDNEEEDTEVKEYFLNVDFKIENDYLLNFGFVGNNKKVEKNKTYALKIVILDNNNKEIINSNNIIKRISIKQGTVTKEGNYKLLDNGFTFDNISTQEDEYLLFKTNQEIENPYVAIKGDNSILRIKSFELFEAYSRGKDILEDTYLEIRPGESKTALQNELIYNYSGREIPLKIDNQNIVYGTINKRDLLLESDVTIGNTYEKQTYFIQTKKNLKTNIEKDTFGDIEKWYEDDNESFDNTKYVEEDFEYKNYELDLLKCPFFDNSNTTNIQCNKEENSLKFCYYQKYGFCPYLFNKEYHPRRIRTLQQSKSNRFNLIQELSKVFEIYPTFTTPHDERGDILSNENGTMQKYVSFITEKGNDQLIGFRYEKNLNNINRTSNSNSITTKLLVDAIDSEYYDTGYCTIQTAQDNLSKNSYILDFSYYTKQGLLDPITTEADLYGLNIENELAFLPNVGSLNNQYDKIEQRISALTAENYKTLKSTNMTNIAGVSAALEEKQKIWQKRSYYKKEESGGKTVAIKTYEKYTIEYNQQSSKLWSLINDLFFTENKYYNPISKEIGEYSLTDKNQAIWFWDNIINNSQYSSWENFKKEVIDKNNYKYCGTIGQENSINEQVQNLQKEANKLLKEITKITKQFNQKYESYLKEGTWSDQNYLTDNEYYWGSVSVLEDSSKPQVNYSINVIDITKSDDENADMYDIDIGDITYVEDIDFFGINPITGLPNKEKVLISEIDYNLDIELNNNIGVQNYTTQFEDLFQQITASVQSLTYNENIYKRAQNFTAKHYVETDSLQGTLSKGNLTLLKTNDSLVIDDQGTEGNAIQNQSSRYKLNGDGLFFSTNGGESWIQAISPKGYNMDYAKFGAIDVGKIKLIDNDYVYFLWDKNGINAYNPDKLDDYVQFNKYGLSLYKDDKIRLRTGYEYIKNGDKEEELNKDREIGFYLYDMNGHDIFTTSVDDNDDDYNMSARLKLKGEIFVYSDHVIPQSGYKLSNEITDLKVIEEGYKVKDNNTNKGVTYLLSIDDGDFTTGGQLSIQSGSRYNFSVLKRYIYNVIENKFPSEASAQDRKDGFNNNAFTGNELKIRNNDDSIAILNSDNGAIYWYTEFKITAIATQNITITFDVEQQEHTLFMGDLFNDNEQGEVTFNTEPLQNYFNHIEVDNNKLTKANRFFIADKYEEGTLNKKEYGNGFDIYSFVQVQGTFEKVSTYNTNIYTCIENNQFIDKNVFVPSSNKYYTTTEASTDISAKTKTAIFINKTKPDNDGDTIKRRIFTIAIKNSNSIVKNMICAFNDGEVVAGGDIMYNNRAYTGDLEKLPDDIVVTNGNILVNPIQ